MRKDTARSPSSSPTNISFLGRGRWGQGRPTSDLQQERGRSPKGLGRVGSKGGAAGQKTPEGLPRGEPFSKAKASDREGLTDEAPRGLAQEAKLCSTAGHRP